MINLPKVINSQEIIPNNEEIIKNIIARHPKEICELFSSFIDLCLLKINESYENKNIEWQSKKQKIQIINKTINTLANKYQNNPWWKEAFTYRKTIEHVKEFIIKTLCK